MMDKRVAKWLLQAGRCMDTAAAIGSGLVMQEDIDRYRQRADELYTEALETPVKWEETK